MEYNMRALFNAPRRVMPMRSLPWSRASGTSRDDGCCA